MRKSHVLPLDNTAVRWIAYLRTGGESAHGRPPSYAGPLLLLGLLLSFLVCGAHCGPSARQINAYVHTLHAFAAQASQRHRALCAPPPPTEAPRDKPAACPPLLSCLTTADKASQVCSALIEQLAKNGQGKDQDCVRQNEAATKACAAAGIIVAPSELAADGGVENADGR